MVCAGASCGPDLLLIVALATVGLVLAAALTAAGMHWLRAGAGSRHRCSGF